jgi:hypothetical protein
MHCPNCGTKTSTEHRFCRACGLGLEKFALLLAEQLPVGETGRAQAEELARLAVLGRRVESWATAAVGTLIALLVGAVFYGIVVKLIIGKGEVVAGLFFLCLILQGLVSVGLIVYREHLKEKMQKKEKLGEHLEPLPAGGKAAGRLLPESRFEPVPSVTEGTTELLTVKKGRR